MGVLDNKMMNKGGMIKLKYHIMHFLPSDQSLDNIKQKLKRAGITMSSETQCVFEHVMFDIIIKSYDLNRGALIELEFRGNETAIDSIVNLDLRIRSLKSDEKGKEIYVIRQWDGLSLYYAELATRKISDIELWVREIISTYYHVAKGTSFSPAVLPKYNDNTEKRKEIGDSIANELNTCDMLFLQYAFLQPFSESDGNSGADFMKDLDECKKHIISFDDFYHKYEMRTLSERISQKHSDKIEGFFETYWGDLYRIRCAWAHHKTMKKDDVKLLNKSYIEAQKIYSICMEEILNTKPTKEMQVSADRLRELLTTGIQSSFNLSFLYEPGMEKEREMLNNEFLNMDRPQFMPVFYVGDTRNNLMDWGIKR